MRLIVAYLLAFLASILSLFVLNQKGLTPTWLSEISLLFQCILIGGIGGITYCFRAVYLNACVRKNWDRDWHPWYYIRPIVSLIVGGVSWLFLKAGLLVLGASQSSDSNNMGFLALAFIAGYNVDKFLIKVEQISESTFGIKKSRISNVDDD